VTTGRDGEDKVQEFVRAYNDIDRHLRQRFGVDGSTPLSEIVREYSNQPGGRWLADRMWPYMNLRNTIIHAPGRAHQTQLFIPTDEALKGILEILNHLTNPVRLIPRFQCEVRTFNQDAMITEVWDTILETDFSQFPVYQDQKFVGLITEQLIARKLTKGLLDQTTIGEEIEYDVADAIHFFGWVSDAYKFLPRTATVEEAIEEFRTIPRIEAILITQNGNESEKLLGIVTLSDLVALG
jgi:CBS domain-containing protein